MYPEVYKFNIIMFSVISC